MKAKCSKVSFWGLFKFALKQKVLIIFSPDFKESDMTDGYLRRIAFCDNLMQSRPRIVLDSEKRLKKTKILRRGNKIVVTFSKNRLARLFWVVLLLTLNRDVYCESVWQVKRIALFHPFVRLFVDVHGAVPEEEFLYRKFESSAFFGDIEELVVKKAQYLFCVTEAMHQHLKQKYGKNMRAKVVILPILHEVSSPDPKAVLNSKTGHNTLAVYAGGIFKWQNIDQMVEIIQQNTSAKYEIYTPNVSGFWKIYGNKNRKNVKVATVSPQELKSKIYPCADYGFVLRDDIVVNNVACPTKISEYLEYGIIPIVKSENIGDFVALGMKYIKAEDFAAGKLYSHAQRKAIIISNLAALERYYAICENGIKKFQEIML